MDIGTVKASLEKAQKERVIMFPGERADLAMVAMIQLVNDTCAAQLAWLQYQIEKEENKESK